MKQLAVSFLTLILVFVITACTGDTTNTGNIVNTSTSTTTLTTTSQTTSPTTSQPENNIITVDYDNEDINPGIINSKTTGIIFKHNTISLKGTGAMVNGSIVTITSAGTYNINGVLDDGQVRVDTDDNEPVILILNGVNITCSTSAPIYILNTKKTVITLAENTENYITDGESYILEDPDSEEPNAAIFSNDDLSINGTGSLIVTANHNNGIQSDDDLKITGGNINVYAINDGIKGKDSVAIKDGNITVTSGGDGLQSNNSDDTTKGYICIEGGKLDINATADGIQAETVLYITGGELKLLTGGGSSDSTSNIGFSDSAKGLKAETALVIDNGTINIDSSDDGIHSDNSITINGGNITITSGDDGVHADATLDINGGEITINKSYEGIESTVITINAGNIHIVSTDDGINVSDCNDTLTFIRRHGQKLSIDEIIGYLHINGGYIAIDANGDGIDVNGPISMTDGTVLINGPSLGKNGAIDYLDSFNISGGFLVAAGSIRMAMAPSTSSTLYSVLANLPSVQPAGTLFHIETTIGEDILTFQPVKEYQSVLVCSPQLEKDLTYIIYTGGSSTGIFTDSLYTNGSYTAGTNITSVTISGIITAFGPYR